MNWTVSEVTILRCGTDPKPLDQVPLADVLDRIRKGRYRPAVERIRAEQDDGRRAKLKLKTIPAFIPAGRFLWRNNESLSKPSGLVALDGDLDGATVEEIRARYQDDPHVVAIFRSVSGEGAAVLVGVDPPPQNDAEHKQAFAAVSKRFGFRGFASGQDDVSRQRYFSYDPELYVNPEALPLHVDYSTEHTKTNFRSQDTLTLLPDGEKYEILRDVGGLLVYAGLSGDMVNTALQALRLEHGETPGEAEPIEKLSRWLSDQGFEKENGLATFRASVIKQSMGAENAIDFLPGSVPGGDGYPDAAEQVSFTYREGFVKETDERSQLIRFRTAAQINATGIPETEYLLHPILPAAALILLTGIAKGGGKTTFLVHLAAALVATRSFLSLRAAEPMSVVYLTEQPERQFFNEYLKPVGIHESENLHILHGFEAASLTWKQAIAASVVHCMDVGARVLIIDTVLYWARLRGDDENSSGAVQTALRPLQDAVAEHGLTIVLAHHDRKGGAQDVYTAGRGSSAWQGVVDLILNLTRPQGNHRQSIRELKTVGRYAAIPDMLMIELTNEGEYVSHGSERAVLSKEARDAIMEVLPIGDENAFTIDKLNEQARKAGADVSDTLIYQETMKLINRGYVQRCGEGKRGDPHRYFRPLPDA